MKKIPLKKAKKKWKLYKARITFLESRLEECEKNRRSSISTRKQFDKNLSKVIKAGRSGAVKKFSKKNILLLTSCSAEEAKVLRGELIYLGYAERRGGAVRWGRKSRYPQAGNIAGVLDD